MDARIWAFMALFMTACSSSNSYPSMNWHRYRSDWPSTPEDKGRPLGFTAADDAPGGACVGTPEGSPIPAGKHACMCVFEDDYLKLKNYMYRSVK